MTASSAPKEILLTIMEGLSNTLTTQAVAVLSYPDNELYQWVGDGDIAEELGNRIEFRKLVEEPYGTLETLAATDDLPGTAYVAAYPVMTPRGPANYVVVIAGSDSREYNAAWSLLQALTREAANELLVQVNAPSIHAALEDAPAGVSIAVMHLADNPLVYVNPGFERVTGYTRAEVVGRSCRFLQGDLANTAERRIIRDALATGQGCTVELENVRKDGRRFTNLLKLRPVYTGETSPAYYIGFQSDITAQREAEQARDSIIDAAPVAMLVADPDGHIRRVNRHLKEMFGYQTDELVGQPVETFIPESVRARHREQRAAFQQAPTKREMGPDRELLALRKDGTEFPIEAGLNHHWERGETRIIAAITEISDRKALEDSLRTARDAAEQASAAKSTFLAQMSHELRTPLNGVLGYAQMMEQEVFGPLGKTKYKDYAADIRRSGELLHELVSNVLDLTRIESGALTIEPEPIKLADLLGDISSVLGHPDLRCGIPEDFVVTTDRSALRQILVNLVSNAVKYGGGTPVHITAARQDGAPVIAVRDEGPGIPEDEIDGVFEPFRRGRRETNTPGTGVGLALCNKFTHALGGCLEIASRESEGTKVTLTLPEAA